MKTYFVYLVLFMFAVPSLSFADDILAEGLENVVVDVTDQKDVRIPQKKGDLIRLTENRLVFLQKSESGGTEAHIYPQNGANSKVEVFSRNTGDKWEWTRQTQKFANLDPKAKPKLLEPLKITPNNNIQKHEDKFLYQCATNLLVRLELASTVDDIETIKAISKRADALKSVQNPSSYYFSELSKQATWHQQNIADRIRIKNDFDKQLAKLKESERIEAQKAANGKLLGFAKLVIGGLTAVESEEYEHYRARYFNNSSIKLAQDGVADIYAATSKSQYDKAYYEHLEGKIRVDLLSSMKRNKEARDKKLNECRSQFELKSKTDFDVSFPSELVELTKLVANNRDYSQLLKIYRVRCDYEQKLFGYPSVYWERRADECELLALSDLLPAKITLAKKKSAKAIELCKLIPQDKLYDIERAEMLLWASKLANHAASLENPIQRTFRSSASISALKAEQCLKEVEKLNLIDLQGTIRMQEVQAYARTGQIDKAAEVAFQCRDICADDAEFQYLSAQVFAQCADNGSLTYQSTDLRKWSTLAMEKAFASGFTRVKEVKKNANLSNMRTEKAFSQLLKPIIQTRLSGDNLIVHNQAKFSMSNVVVRVEMSVGQKIAPTTFVIPYWPSGQAISLFDLAQPKVGFFTLQNKNANVYVNANEIDEKDGKKPYKPILD